MKKTALTDGIAALQQGAELRAEPPFSQNTQYPGIDLAKFILAFFICTIHIVPFDLKGEGWDCLNFWLKNYLCRIAVPYYFAAAGFLLFRKMTPEKIDPDRIRNYCLKILRLLGTWILLLFVGSREHLWFLPAVVMAVILVSLLMRAGFRLKVIGAVVLLLYLLGLLGDSWHGLLAPLDQFPFLSKALEDYKILFSTTRNGVFFGAVYIFMGAALAFCQKRIKPIAAAIGLILSMGALAVEVFLLRSYSRPKDYNMLVCLLPATYFLMNLTIHAEIRNKPVYKRLRIIGMLVFYLHLFVDYFTGHLIQVAKKSAGLELSPVRLLITVTVTVCAAVVIERLSKRERCRWLRFLYS